jgi:hypothetical protein
MLPLIKSAVQSGHEVAVATGLEGIEAASVPGVRVMQLGLSWSRVAERYARHLAATNPEFASPDERQLHFIGFAFAEVAGPAMARDLIRFSQSWKPDMIISDLTELGGRVAATLRGIPHVMHGLGPQQPVHLAEPIGTAIEILQAGFGIKAEQSRRWNEDLYLDVWPKSISLGDKYSFPNALPIRSVTPRLDLSAATILDGLPFDSTVYVTLGTMFNTTPGALEKLVKVFDGLAVNAIVTIGRDGDLSRFAPSPENVRIERFIPQDSILPFVDAVLSHGGAATTLGALAHGKPHVMTPVATDQHIIAASVSTAGAGITVAEPSRVEDVRAAVLLVLAEPHFAHAARRLAPSVYSSPDSDDVLDVILYQLQAAQAGRGWDPDAVAEEGAARSRLRYPKTHSSRSSRRLRRTRHESPGSA